MIGLIFYIGYESSERKGFGDMPEIYACIFMSAIFYFTLCSILFITSTIYPIFDILHALIGLSGLISLLSLLFFIILSSCIYYYYIKKKSIEIIEKYSKLKLKWAFEILLFSSLILFFVSIVVLRRIG